MPRLQPTVLQDPFGLLDPKFIDKIVDMLNGKSAESRELRSLVIRWKASGPNLQKMVRADRALWGGVQEIVRGFWTPSDHARAYLVPSSSGCDDHNPTPVRNARFKFAILVLHPDCVLVGGPCEICGNWFKQATRHRTRFCTKRCASLGRAPAAIQSTNDRRREAHKRRIEWAQEAIGSWSSKPRTEGWTSWVLRHVNRRQSIWAGQNKELEKNPLTKKWLTRWLNEGQLRNPSTKKVRKK